MQETDSTLHGNGLVLQNLAATTRDSRPSSGSAPARSSRILSSSAPYPGQAWVMSEAIAAAMWSIMRSGGTVML